MCKDVPAFKKYIHAAFTSGKVAIKSQSFFGSRDLNLYSHEIYTRCRLDIMKI